MFDLASTIEALRALPSKRNDQDLKETISMMATELRAAKKRGHTIPELAKWLNERGLRIGPTTLRGDWSFQSIATGEGEAMVAHRRIRMAVVRVPEGSKR